VNHKISNQPNTEKGNMTAPMTPFNEPPPLESALGGKSVETEADIAAHVRSQIAALNKLIDARNDPEQRAELREEIGSICMSWYLGKLLAEADAEDNPPEPFTLSIP
jgi:hypothetical protein